MARFVVLTPHGTYKTFGTLSRYNFVTVRGRLTELLELGCARVDTGPVMMIVKQDPIAQAKAQANFWL